ncbi:MAG: sodium:proton exchanger [Acidimicrobiia bacterium]
MSADSPHRRRGQLTALAGGFALTVPGLVVRISGIGAPSWVEAIVYGLAVVGAAFLLAWAAEVLQLDVSAGLALAVLALIAVLPEYAVDFVFASKAGTNPDKYAPLALANMTGGNRLLIGIGWSLVVLLAAWRMRKIARERGYEGPIDDEVQLDRSHSVEIAFLMLATIYSLTLPLKRELMLFDSVVLIGLFVGYLVRIARAPAETPHLVGPAELIGKLPQTKRRVVVVLLLVFAAGVILASAEGFAEALVNTGKQFGIDEFLLVQWLAPLASEAPELLIAGLFAWRLNTNAALGALLSSKVNQWTLLVGSLPIVFAISSQSLHGLPLDALQREELFLTAAQSAFAVAVLANRSISVKEAYMLLGLFLSQFVLGAALPEGVRELERIAVGVVYLVLAAVIIFRNWSAFPRVVNDGLRVPVADLALGDEPTPEPA